MPSPNPADVLTGLFDKTQAGLIQASHSAKTVEAKQAAEEIKRQYAVMNWELQQRGVNGLINLLTDPDELRRRNIDGKMALDMIGVVQDAKNGKSEAELADAVQASVKGQALRAQAHGQQHASHANGPVSTPPSQQAGQAPTPPPAPPSPPPAPPAAPPQAGPRPGQGAGGSGTPTPPPSPPVPPAPPPGGTGGGHVPPSPPAGDDLDERLRRAQVRTAEAQAAMAERQNEQHAKDADPTKGGLYAAGPGHANKKRNNAGIIGALALTAASLGGWWASNNLTGSFNDQSASGAAGGAGMGTSSIESRTYSTAAQKREAVKGTYMTAVSHSLMLTLDVQAKGQNKHILQEKTGLKPEQYFRLYNALRLPANEAAFAELLASHTGPEDKRKASLTFVRQADGNFRRLPPGDINRDKSAMAVEVEISKARVSLAVVDPETDQADPRRRVEFLQGKGVQAEFILNADERAKAKLAATPKIGQARDDAGTKAPGAPPKP